MAQEQLLVNKDLGRKNIEDIYLHLLCPKRSVAHSFLPGLSIPQLCPVSTFYFSQIIPALWILCAEGYQWLREQGWGMGMCTLEQAVISAYVWESMGIPG